MTAINPRAMFFFQNRLDTFKNWVHKDNSTTKCTPQRMAKAGFYCVPNSNDAGKCFVCMKVLDSWEQDDDPLEEHKKHAPKCPFIKLGKEEENYTLIDLLELSENMDVNIVAETFEEEIKKLHEQKERLVNELKRSERKKKNN